MILTKSSTEIIPQDSGLLGIYKAIEIAGRTSYKSEDRITPDSAEKFCQMLMDRGHLSPFEFGTVYLTIPYTEENEVAIDLYFENPYSAVKWQADDAYVTTNMRVLIENNWLDALRYLSDPTLHERRITARVICSRSIGNELVRHRLFSYVQESSRYCNYSKSKFNGQVTFILPHWCNLEPGEYTKVWYDLVDDKSKVIINKQVHEFGINDIPYEYETLINSFSDSEFRYMKLLDRGIKPQDAREVLPLGLKTEIVMCGFKQQWDHFFELRTASGAHPDMQIIAKDLKQKMECL